MDGKEQVLRRSSFLQHPVFCLSSLVWFWVENTEHRCPSPAIKPVLWESEIHQTFGQSSYRRSTTEGRNSMHVLYPCLIYPQSPAPWLGQHCRLVWLGEATVLWAILRSTAVVRTLGFVVDVGRILSLGLMVWLLVWKQQQHFTLSQYFCILFLYVTLLQTQKYTRKFL